MKNFFDNLLEIINKSETGHLPLKYRVDLMKSIGDYNVVNKV
ncbi:Imm5 family immunity protein [Chryseobacterium sp.]